MTAVTIPEKKYFRIGEVSDITGVEAYVLRYWETEFKQINPKRTESGQRLYSQKDVALVLTIKQLLYTDKFTIQGAKKHLNLISNNRRKPVSNFTLESLMAELLEIKDLLD